MSYRTDDGVWHSDDLAYCLCHLCKYRYACGNRTHKFVDCAGPACNKELGPETRPYGTWFCLECCDRLDHFLCASCSGTYSQEHVFKKQQQHSVDSTGN